MKWAFLCVELYRLQFQNILSKYSAKKWTMWIKDRTARSVQSDFNLLCPHKLFDPSSASHKIKMIPTLHLTN